MIESKHNPLGPITQLLRSVRPAGAALSGSDCHLSDGTPGHGLVPSALDDARSVASVASSFGLALLLAQVARDRGKRLEPALYDTWGGKPSVALLRHRDTRIDEHTKSRYREFLKGQLPQLKLATIEEEGANPEAADNAYQSVTAWLLTQTRDTKRFSILFRENISFGFRRNLWGLKPVGIAVTLMASCASTAAIAYRYWAEQRAPLPKSRSSPPRYGCFCSFGWCHNS